MFVDELVLKLKAGDGGSGCTSFRREKYVPMGGPDGGNGGRGASIVFVTDKGLKTLIDLSYKKIVKAPKGENGKGSNKYGKNAEDLIIKVPMGTTIYNKETNKYKIDNKELTSDELIKYYEKLINSYPILSIEDPFDEDDFESLKKFTSLAGNRIMVVGDDYFVTNEMYLKKGI